MYYPINKDDRATGFLLPIYGTSTIKGQTINNAFFWAINRSQDATLYHNFYSKTGQGFGGDYRYVQSAGSSGSVQTSFLREHEAIYEQAGRHDRTRAGHRTATRSTAPCCSSCRANLRLTGSANYFSSLVSQQRYQQDSSRRPTRTRNFGGNVSGQLGRDSLQRHRSTATRSSPTTPIRTCSASLPRVLYSRAREADRQLPLYFGASSEYVTLIRHGKTARPRSTETRA